jgi:MYXO-CTERM domain-containing protein
VLGVAVSITMLATGAPARALEASGFTYTIDGGSATVTGCTGTCPTALVIPDTLGGYSVTTVGDGAFTSNRITSVTIPRTVTTIEDYAFADNELRTLTIPSSVQSIWEEAFSQNQITSLTLENGVTGIGAAAFGNNQISSLTIPGSVRWGRGDGDGAFAFNPLTSLTIEDGVTSIPQAAFLRTNLTSVTIPSSVTSIGAYAFGEEETGDPLVTIVFEGDAPTAGGNVFLTPDTAVGSGGSHTATLAIFQHVVTATTNRKNLSVMRVWRQPSATGWSSTWSGAQVVTIGGPAIATVKPAVTGTAAVNMTLTAAKGTWTGYPTPTLTYQWYACTRAVTVASTTIPSTCAKISGATRSTFNPTSTERDKYVAVLVTGKSAGTTATAWLSKTTTTIGVGAPEPTASLTPVPTASPVPTPTPSGSPVAPAATESGVPFAIGALLLALLLGLFALRRRR